MSHQRIEQPEDYTRSWTIVRLLPKAQRYTVTQFANRQDAQDHKRVRSTPLLCIKRLGRV
jgi:hypothetical protein